MRCDDLRHGDGAMVENDRDRRDYFQTTAWSLVLRAGDPAAESYRDALEELLRRYWPALRGHLVAVKRIDPHEADDLVQEFTREKVLEAGLLGRADRNRGKFRTLLLTALDHYVADRHRRRGARKRRFEAGGAELGPGHGAADGAGDPFAVEWARATLDDAVGRMRAECEGKDRADLWGVFEARVLAEALGGSPTLSYEELVARFGFRSPTQASNALMTAKRMFARVLRSVLAEYAGEDGAEDELRDLRQALVGGPTAPR